MKALALTLALLTGCTGPMSEAESEAWSQALRNVGNSAQAIGTGYQNAAPRRTTVNCITNRVGNYVYTTCN